VETPPEKEIISPIERFIATVGPPLDRSMKTGSEAAQSCPDSQGQGKISPVEYFMTNLYEKHFPENLSPHGIACRAGRSVFPRVGRLGCFFRQSNLSWLPFAALALATLGGNLTITPLSPRTRCVRNAQQAGFACLQALVERQLPGGGWPSAGTAQQMAVEPTALALLALPSTVARTRFTAITSLLHTQNPNGSWPAFSGDDQHGSGYTGLAVYALHHCGESGMPTRRAVTWLLRSRGCESRWLCKWKFRTTDRHVRFNPDKFGWAWMPETVSWVFPTTYSLLALKRAHRESRGRLLEFRIRRGVEMLYDRICPGGGWNAGNGVVYRSPLAPHPDATAAALLALLGEPPNDSVTSSLDWLERRAETLRTPWSLAWTILALHAFERSTQSLIDRLCVVVEPAEIRDGATLAAVCLGLGCGNGPNVFGAEA